MLLFSGQQTRVIVTITFLGKRLNTYKYGKEIIIVQYHHKKTLTF